MHDHYRTKNESHIKFISKYWKLLHCVNYNITKNKKMFIKWTQLSVQMFKSKSFLKQTIPK